MRVKGRTFIALLIFGLVSAAPVMANNNQSSLDHEAASLYEQALVKFNEGDTATSVIHLKNALQEDPGYLSAHILLGKAYLKDGQGSLAEKELKRAQDLGADKSLILADLAQALMLQVKFREVLERIKPEGQSAQLDSTLQVYRAQSYFQLGELDQATLEFKDALSTRSDTVDAVLGLAAVALAREDYPQAATYIEQGVAIDHENASVWYAKGSLHHAQGQIEQARVAYETALKITPEHFNSKLSLAGLYMDRGDYAAAKKAFAELYQSSPENPQIAYFLSIASAKLGEPEQAKKKMQEAKSNLEVLPNEVINEHGPTLLLAGLIHYDLGEYQAAKTYLGSFVHRSPSDVRARLIMARIYLMEGAWAKTTALLEPALEIHPRNYQLLVLLGDAYMKKKDYFKASRLFEQASEYYPRDRQLQVRSGLNDILRGEKEVGMETLAVAAEQNTQAGAAGFLLVTNLIRQGDIKAALRHAERLSLKSPDNLLIRNLLASTQLKAGQADKARANWTEILSSEADFKLAKINLIKLDIFEGHLDQAETDLMALMQTDPENTTYLADLAEIQLKRGQSELAIKSLEKANSLKPGDYKIADRLVSLFIQQGDSGKALTVASKLVNTLIEDATAYLLLGKAQFHNGEPYKAQASLKKASQLADYNATLLKGISHFQILSGDFTGALYSLEKFLSSFPEDADSWYQVADTRLKLDPQADISEPIETLRKLGFAALSDRLAGDQAYQQLNYSKAREFYQASLKRKNLMDTAIRLFTTISAEEGMKEGATFLRSWVDKNPQAHPAREVLARSLVTTEQYKAAQAQLERLFDADWKSPVALVNLAYVYQVNNHPQAEMMARKALEVRPEDPFALDNMGWVLVKKGDYKGGLSYLRSAYSRDSQSLSNQYHIAFTLHKLGRDSEARDQLDRLIQVNEPFKELEQAKALVQEIGLQGVN